MVPLGTSRPQRYGHTVSHSVDMPRVTGRTAADGRDAGAADGPDSIGVARELGRTRSGPTGRPYFGMAFRRVRTSRCALARVASVLPARRTALDAAARAARPGRRSRSADPPGGPRRTNADTCKTAGV